MIVNGALREQLGFNMEFADDHLPLCYNCDLKLAKFMILADIMHAMKTPKGSKLDPTEMLREITSIISTDERLYVKPKHLKETLIPPNYMVKDSQPMDKGVQKNSTGGVVSDGKINSDKVPYLDHIELKKKSEDLDLPQPGSSKSIKRQIECVLPEHDVEPIRGSGQIGSMNTVKPSTAEPEQKCTGPSKPCLGFYRSINVSDGKLVKPNFVMGSETMQIPGVDEVVNMVEGEIRMLRFEKLLGRDPLDVPIPVDLRDHHTVGKIVLSPTVLNLSEVEYGNSVWREHNKSRSLISVLPIFTKMNGKYKVALLALHLALLRPEARPVLNALQWKQIAEWCFSLELEVPCQVEMYEERADLNIPGHPAPVAIKPQ